MAVALVLGGAACLWDDVSAALELGEYGAVIACNDAGASWPGPLDAMVSLHAEKLAKTWLPERLKNGYQSPKLVVANDPGHKDCVPPLDRYTWPFFPGQFHSGSSGLMAAKVARIDLGFDRAVLCGIPMNDQRHFFDRQPWKSATSHTRGWDEAMKSIKDSVRSMSGITREWLGAPTSEWVMGL